MTPDLTNSFYAALGLTLAGAAFVYQLLLRRRGLRGSGAWITLGLGLPLGFVCAKLGFLLSEVDRLFLGMLDPLGADAISLSVTTFSFVGACAGFVLAAFLAARILRQPAGACLDVLAAPLCGAVACVRLAERYLPFFNIGDTPITAPWLQVFPVSAPDNWGDWVLTLWALSAVAALVCLALSLLPAWRRTGADGVCFGCTVCLLCGLQLLPEMARVDPIKINQFFVRTDQILCALAMLGLLIAWGVWRKKRGAGGFLCLGLPLILFFLCVGVHILAQFTLDKPYKILAGLSESAQLWCADRLQALCWIPMAVATAGMIALCAVQAALLCRRVPPRTDGSPDR